MMLQAVFFIVGAYLVGAIPVGYLLARILKGIDIREHGSGNVGATNVKRVVGTKAGLITLILDFLKGLVPVLIVQWIFSPLIDPHRLIPVLAAIAAVIGHSKSIYIGFSGGKSVITSLGVLLALAPMAALLAVTVAILTMKMTRYVSVGSMLGAVLAPLFVWLFHGPPLHVLMSTFIGGYIIWRHKANIYRLLGHQENRL
jgi:glycerol-3-phosphate acyltransferase PlsY